MRRHAAQVGLEQADLWLGLTDGGNGLEDFIVANFGRPDVVLILDFWHPAEDLGELARLWHPKDEKAAQQQAQAWCHTRKHRGGQAILAELQALAVPRRADVKEKYTEVVRYLRALFKSADGQWDAFWQRSLN